METEKERELYREIIGSRESVVKGSMTVSRESSAVAKDSIDKEWEMQSQLLEAM